MKKVLPVILVFFATVSFVYSQGTWARITSPVQENLRKICFVDSLYGWAAGDSGVILRTTNGGLNWVQQNRNISLYFMDFSENI